MICDNNDALENSIFKLETQTFQNRQANPDLYPGHDIEAPSRFELQRSVDPQSILHRMKMRRPQMSRFTSQRKEFLVSRRVRDYCAEHHEAEARQLAPDLTRAARIPESRTRRAQPAKARARLAAPRHRKAAGGNWQRAAPARQEPAVGSS